jgi:hypothetical protein
MAGVRVAALAAVVLAAECSPQLGGPVGPVSVGTPGPDVMAEEDTAGLRRAFALRLLEVTRDGKPTEGMISRIQAGIQVVKAVRAGPVAFLLAVVTERGDSAQAFVSLLREGRGWRVDDLRVVRGVPEVGSNDFDFEILTVGALVGVGGFVDPTASRVDTVDPFGRVIDADDPLAGGAIVVSDRFGLTRIHRRERVIGAVPVTIAATPEELREFQPARLEGTAAGEARAVADGFVRAFLSGGWVPATTFYNPGGRPDLLLPPMADVLSPGPWELSGPVEVKARGFLYPIEGPGGRAVLDVQLNRWAGDWKVARMMFLTPPGGDTPGPIG